MQRVVNFLGWAIAIACGICAAAFFVALFVIGCTLVPTGHEGDLGTWAGAVFAGLAFAGTIWLASSSERRRREDLPLRGEVIIPAIFGYLLEMKLRISTIHAFLEHWRDLEAAEQTDENWRYLSKRCLENARECPQIPDSYLLDVMAISKQLVKSVHMAHAQMRSLFAAMHPYAFEDAMVRFDDIDLIIDSASNCLTRLGEAKAMASFLSKTHGFDTH